MDTTQTTIPPALAPEQIEHILAGIRNVKIAICGDFCLDAYWFLDPKPGEVSLETQLPSQAVARQSYSLGGAANIAADLAALAPKEIKTIGIVGDDLFGRELVGQLNHLGLDTTGLIVQKENFDTVTFAKRIQNGREQQRIDFGFLNKRSTRTDHLLLDHLQHALDWADAVIFNQQVPGSITNPSYIDRVNDLFERFTHKIVLLDSRHYSRSFNNSFRKFNDIEAVLTSWPQSTVQRPIPINDLGPVARTLYRQFQKPVFITRGARGILAADKEGLYEIPGIQLPDPLDPVGAGDTILSTLTLALAAGVDIAQTAQFANLAAAVTVQKRFQTGTAGPAEILQIAQDPHDIYRPELSQNPNAATFLGDSKIELCCNPATTISHPITHALFDHDGTLSTLRRDWPSIMEQLFINVILDNHPNPADHPLYQKIQTAVSNYIDSSTGIQTIYQMETLVELARKFAIASPETIADKFHYKKIFSTSILRRVNGRLDLIDSGKSHRQDWIINGAVEFLHALCERNVKLYLASGSDHDDVRREAHLLGYGDLFDGGIYGSLDDLAKFSKKRLIQNIIQQENIHPAQLVVFGDGPVEIRQALHHHAIAVGVATDETHPQNLNQKKRTRLIQAGAHLILPDFSPKDTLLQLLL